MKIGIITDDTDTQLVGFGTYTLSLVKAILALDKKNEYYLIHRRKEEQEIYKMGAKEIIVPYNPKFPFSTIRNFITLPQAIRKYDLDIVHHPSTIGPFALKQLWPTKKGKTIATIHEIMPLLYPESFEKPVRLAFKYLLPRIAKNVDRIFTSSEHSKKDIAKRFNVPLGRIDVIYPAPNPAFRKLDRKKCKQKLAQKYDIREDFLLFVSTLERKKNISTLLKAFKLLKDKGYKHKLVLVGKKGYGYEGIEDTIKQLQLEKDVVMPGYAPVEDLPLFYNAAEAFIFPSKYEGFGMTVVDAMKCGCPVVASNGGGIPEAAGTAGITVDVFDTKGYADAVEKILNNKKLADSMRRKALLQAKKFSWEKSAKKVIEAYERL